MIYDAYHLVYKEPNKSFRQSGSELLKKIASFSSEYFVLTHKFDESFYDMLMRYARLYTLGNINQIKQNAAFNCSYDDLLMHTYAVILPINIDPDIRQGFNLITDDYADNLYELSDCIALVDKTQVEIK